MKESHFLLRRTAGYSKFSSLLSLLMQFYFIHQNYQNCQLTKKTVCFCSHLSTNHIFDVLSLGLSFQLLLFRVALGVMKNETSRFYPFVCMRNILHKACAVCISQPEDIFYCIYLCLWQMATLLYFISLILSWTALLLTTLSLILISYCPYYHYSITIFTLNIFYHLCHLQYTAFISHTMEKYYLSFPDGAIERWKLGIKIQYNISRPQLNQYIYRFQKATERQLQMCSKQNR